MASPPILVTSQFLYAQREVWGAGLTLIGPVTGPGGVDPVLARQIRVLVSDGECLDPALVESLTRLQLVACFSSGYAGIDVAQLQRRGIALTTAAGVNAHDVADHAIALLLAWWHGLSQAERRVREGLWRQNLRPRASLRGRHLGIVGLGRIGVCIAQRAEALGLVVNWWGPREKADTRFARTPSLLSLARDSDILVIAARAEAANRGLIDARILEALGAKGLLVNVSRGLLVDETALIQALQRGILGGAALDVFSQEPPDRLVWEGVPNVVLSPHIGGFTQEAGTAMFGQLAENISRYFAGLPLLTPVTGLGESSAVEAGR